MFEYLHFKEHLIVISHVYKGLFEIVGIPLISLYQEGERPNDEQPEDWVLIEQDKSKYP